MIRFDHFSEVTKHGWRWPNFTPREMADSFSGRLVLEPKFMDWLQGVRTEYGRPMIVTSGYRTPEHQRSLPGRRITGSHVDGMAVDVKVYGRHALDLLRVACENGATGVGVHQTADIRRRYLHLDIWDKAPLKVRPGLWSYHK